MSKEGMSRPPAPLTSSSVERAMLALCEVCLAENPFERPDDAGAVEAVFRKALSGPSWFQYRKGVRAVALAGLALVVGGAVVNRMLEIRRTTPSVPVEESPRRLDPLGTPSDWRNDATIVAGFSGPVHCFSVLNANTVRVVWGGRRTAEDVDVGSGRRWPAPIRGVTYRSGCPELSPRGDRLLYTSVSAAGTTEIWISETPNGDGGKAITPGLEPLWLRSGEEFLYTIDPYHAAVFSLSTMSFSLLAGPGIGGRHLVSEKTVGSRGDAVALRLVDDAGRLVIAVYEGRSLSPQKAFVVSAGYRMDFAETDDELFVSYNRSAGLSTLAALDWKNERFRHMGRYPGFDLVRIQPAADDSVVILARHRAKDAWLHGPSGKTRLTTDGETLWATMSPAGDFLFGKRAADGTLAIWLQRDGQASRQVTRGPVDAQPSFGADGKRWAYVDYSKKGVVVCEIGREKCDVVLVDEGMPAWPTLSPDGRYIAYIREADAQRIVVMSLADRRKKYLGMGFSQCPPIWSSADRLWVFEGSARKYFWSERDIASGDRTGRLINLGESLNDAAQQPDQARCWPTEAESAFSIFPRVRVEAQEEARILRLPSRALRQLGQ